MIPTLQGGCRQPHSTGSQRGDPDELERLVHDTDATSEPRGDFGSFHVLICSDQRDRAQFKGTESIWLVPSRGSESWFRATCSVPNARHMPGQV